MDGTRVLVAYASERGSTAGIAEAIGATFRRSGFAADVRPVAEVEDVSGYDAAVVGSAVYMMRWRKDAIRFLRRFRMELAARPVWLFQSGPLDRSAEEKEIPLPRKVGDLARGIAARGHATFGGRLGEDATGFVARKMAASGAAGDFRDFDRIEGWTEDIGLQLSAAAGRPVRGAATRAPAGDLPGR